MTDETTIYDQLDVPTVVNCVGEQTRVSGTLLRPEAADAMREAADAYVHLGDLQARASELIADATGAEAGYVTNGAASGLTLATAACMVGDDYAEMNRIPHVEDAPNEVVIPCPHRNEYQVAFRAAGATLVSAGMNDLSDGLEDIEPWEVDAAITEDAAAVVYVERPHHTLALEPLVEVAHGNDVPVIVDAAAELPPTSNLERFVDAGADLVAFSGGKAVRGPQTTGILAGRSDLLRSVALQQLPSGTHEALWDPPASLIDTDEVPGMPRHGIGRPMKVGKEELVGLIRALELFLEEDQEALRAERNQRASRIASELRETDGLSVTVADDEDPSVVSEVRVGVDAPIALETLIRRLREENPRVFVGEGALEHDVFTIVPKCLSDEQAAYVVERIRANLP